ncbi:MAG TPA: endonuclease domain-containing protein [Novosphingobium sp.]|nr:endonuclease domain-containing protein [Novosphingobium sp.]
MQQQLGTIRKARQLRRKMTLPEVLLWQHLRRSPLGLKFRRQHPIGPYVLDFYCPSAKTGIEIDGIAHAMGHNPERDLARDVWLQAQGVSLIRLPAAQVLKNAPETAETIVRTCTR